MNRQPESLLFAQHGWDDNARTIASLAARLASPQMQVVAPNLNRLQTWLRMEPLLQQLERSVAEAIASSPEIPWRIIGHSMGGLLWLELLHRRPEWQQRVHSLVLIASPVGGADLARIIDPFGLGIGIARDLGRDRRLLAESIAAEIPTLAIASNLGNRTDGTIAIGTTQFAGCHWLGLSGIAHPHLRNHPQVEAAIRAFWGQSAIAPVASDLASQLVRKLRSLPGATDASDRFFSYSRPYLDFPEGIVLRRWHAPWQVEYIFVVDREGNGSYAGFVGWRDTSQFRSALSVLAAELGGKVRTL